MTIQPNPAPTGGPYLQAALFCDQVIRGDDGVITIVRVIDRLNHRVMKKDAPADMEPFTYNLTALVMLKAGEVRGSHRLGLVVTNPAGERTQLPAHDVYLEGEADRGVNTVLRMVITFNLSGLHWFDVFFDEHLLTKVPFRVVYLRN